MPRATGWDQCTTASRRSSAFREFQAKRWNSKPFPSGLGPEPRLSPRHRRVAFGDLGSYFPSTAGPGGLEGVLPAGQSMLHPDASGMKHGTQSNAKCLLVPLDATMPRCLDAFFLRTRPPVDEQREEVGRADVGVAVEVRQVRRRERPGRRGVEGSIHRYAVGETPSADSGRCVRAVARVCLDRQSFRLQATRFDLRA